MNSLEKSLPDFSSEAIREDVRIPQAVLDWGLELRLWVATCVAGLALFSVRSLGIPLSRATWSAVGVTFLSTLALYNLDGSLDAPERSSQTRARAGARRRWLHLGVTALSTIALLSLLGRLSTRALLLTSLGALVCGFYAVPLTPIRRHTTAGPRALRLKSLPFIKAPFVGCAVGIATVWVPIVGQDASYSLSAALVLTVVLSLYCTNNALLFDIPDVSEDERAQVPTLPACSGLAITRRWSRTLALTGASTSLVYAGLFGTIADGAGLLSLGGALLVFTELFHFRTSRRMVAWWVDGALLLPLGFHMLQRALP